MPEGVVSVTRPGPWGNPFTVAAALEIGFATNEADARKFVVECFRDWFIKGDLSEWWFINGTERWAWMRAHRDELYGRSLACYCPIGAPCHADVLLELANGEAE